MHDKLWGSRNFDNKEIDMHLYSSRKNETSESKEKDKNFKPR